MPGAMRKLGLYLGLVEDDADRHLHHDGYDEHDEHVYGEPEPVAVRGYRPGDEPRPVVPRRSFDDARTRGTSALDLRPQQAPRPSAVPAYDEGYRITTLHPRTYNEARTIGEHFREGTPVIMNLTEMDDTDAKRLVDFAAGLIFGLRGRIERVTNKVFLLSPEHVEVTAEDKARIAEGGFFNQS